MSPGEQAVRAAMDYAETEGEGAGYWLLLRMVDGTELEGACYAPKNGIIRMDVFDSVQDEIVKPVWVNLEYVQSAAIDFS